MLQSSLRKEFSVGKVKMSVLMGDIHDILISLFSRVERN